MGYGMGLESASLRELYTTFIISGMSPSSFGVLKKDGVD